VCALDGETFLAELLKHGSQEGIIALAGLQDQAGQHGHPPQIGLEGGEVGSGDIPGQADRVALGLLKDPDAPPNLCQSHLGPGKGLHGGVGKASEAHHKEGPASILAVLGDLQGQVTPARDEAQASGHLD
jgi:hypothetical protein